MLGRYINKRLIELQPHTRGETVGVLRRDGTYEYRRWLGFINREQALSLGSPVKLQVARVGRQGEFHTDWRDIPRGRHIQGCLTGQGVYAVVDWSVRVV